jgi:uncharacterized protein YfcZ (UPF0381/DUF406 family)
MSPNSKPNMKLRASNYERRAMFKAEKPRLPSRLIDETRGVVDSRVDVGPTVSRSFVSRSPRPDKIKITRLEFALTCSLLRSSTSKCKSKPEWMLWCCCGSVTHEQRARAQVSRVYNAQRQARCNGTTLISLANHSFQFDLSNPCAIAMYQLEQALRHEYDKEHFSMRSRTSLEEVDDGLCSCYAWQIYQKVYQVQEICIWWSLDGADCKCC